jgi:MFS family permease
MFVFFCGFNALEATQPSLVSRMAPPALRGAALGAYNTLQSLGLFAGGALGGLLAKWAGAGGLFAATALLTCAVAAAHVAAAARGRGTDAAAGGINQPATRPRGMCGLFEYGLCQPTRNPVMLRTGGLARGRFIRSSGPETFPLPSGLLPKEFLWLPSTK